MCGESRGSCVRKTTPVLIVTSTRLLTSAETNVAVIRRVGERFGVAGVVVAAAGFL